MRRSSPRSRRSSTTDPGVPRATRRVVTVTAPARSLPDFPWNRLVPYSAKAREHPGGVVDLSVGTPVDSTPELAQQALAEASNAPGYPFTAGTQAVRDAAAGWLTRRLGVAPRTAVLPTPASQELPAPPPSLLGLHAGG